MSTRPPTWRQLLEAATDKGSSQQPLFSDSQPAPSCASQQPLASWAPEQRSGAPKKPPSPPALSLTQPQDTSRTTDAGPTVDQFLTQPIPRDAMPAESPSQGNPAAACSQIQQEASQHPRLPETQCTQSVFDTQATQAVPSMPDLASDLGVQEGPGLLPISLEHYGTLYTELVGKDGAGRVKACYGLEENKFSKVDLKQVLSLHGLGDGSRSRKDILAMMVGMSLFCPFQSSTPPPIHDNSIGISMEECESHLAALGWNEGPITSVEHIKPHASATTQHPVKLGGSHEAAGATASLHPVQLPVPASRAPASLPCEIVPQAHAATSACVRANPCTTSAPAPLSSVAAQAPPRPTGMSGVAALGIAHPAAATHEMPRPQPFLGSNSAHLPTSMPSQAPGFWMGPNPKACGHLGYGPHSFPYPFQGPYNHPHAHMTIPFPPWTHLGNDLPTHDEAPSCAPDSRKAGTTAPAKASGPPAKPAPQKVAWKKQTIQKLRSDLARHKAVLEPLATSVTGQDCVLVALLEDVVVSPTGRGQETVRKGIHVAAVGRSLKVAHDSELCSPGCKEEHVFHMLRIAVERQPSVSAKKAASAKKPLPLQDECLELKVDLHRRNQLLTWEDWEAKIAAGSPDLEDLWMKVDPLVDTATSGKQAVTGFKRKMQGLTGSSHKEILFQTRDVVWCLEGSVMWPAQVLQDTSSDAPGEVEVELFGSPRVQKEVKLSCLRPFDSFEVNPQKHSRKFRAAFEQARSVLEGPVVAEGKKGSSVARS